MPTREQLDSFHQFATSKLTNGDAEISWQELFDEWRLVNLPPKEAAELKASLRRGIADIEAGRHQPADEVMGELRKKHNFPE